MGNIKKQRKKYNLPFKKWDKTRADAEDGLVSEFGLANKKEVWKANMSVSRFRTSARTLFTKSGAVAERMKKDLTDKAHKLGLLTVESATLDDLLGITAKDILGRRLQTIVVKKGLANTSRQARQFIVHGHVLVGGRVVTVPSYMVAKSEEASVDLRPKSALSNPSHPARMTPQKKEDARLLEEIRKKKAAEAAATAKAIVVPAEAKAPEVPGEAEAPDPVIAAKDDEEA